MKSIRRWLLGWLIFGFAAMSAVAGLGIFQKAREEASELFDYELRTVALSMPADVQGAIAAEHSSSDGLDSIADDRLSIEIWNQAGQLLYQSPDSPPPERFPPGIRTARRGDHHWRVFSLAQPGRFVQVAQPVSVRNDLALRLAWHTLWPLLVMVPVAIAFVLWVVSRGFAPVGRLSKSLGTRSIESLEPLPDLERLPVEVRPLAEALNDLLERLGTALQAQRRFIADAAHELRSPLAALKLQLQAAVSDGSLRGDERTLARVEGRLNRLIHLVQQLLTLAREDAQVATVMQPVSLRHVGEQVVGDLSLLAEAKGIDLGLECRDEHEADDRYVVLGEQHALSIMLANLVDNAIRYTPPGGTVDVVLRRAGDSVAFDVRDTGPGIPADELGRVFDRFYRGSGSQAQGSGLGLAIAQHIALRHHVALTMANNAGGPGLTVSATGL
ncbi:two-component system OmpR family sensor kinase [Paraburkholderia caballeronis]|uniref:ATP-binding protein n=1 Tax=Paraburkholderia caballeronis TaxID=416943 RepID=UPI0010657093|nr:ATP-binding protein [Paraburkholderia caballeronis]TDV23841.1 two-component system OmpR family sensor kinase [Paraburkholderia caballeronis]